MNELSEFETLMHTLENKLAELNSISRKHYASFAECLRKAEDLQTMVDMFRQAGIESKLSVEFIHYGESPWKIFTVLMLEVSLASPMSQIHIFGQPEAAQAQEFQDFLLAAAAKHYARRVLLVDG